ncbi:phosphatidate phosphatase LPIN isoform X2 [Rhynchophorus ferrugineus]|uniref:phosphatidate phosphatase LPIN isoform X2 n=1 Tax=Rhynchophorus ferrugineus TaxID=354439 RepID=UPI003FCD7A56
MMRFFSNFKDFYNEINGATLTGAIDVVVVKQPDGTYKCSPFHVRFGKLGVLRSKAKVVDIELNGEPLTIHMKLGESGEAFFVEELEDDGENDIPDHLATSPIPVSELEHLFTNQGRRRSFNLENETNSYEKRRHTADNQMTTRTNIENFLERQIELGNIEGTSAEDITVSATTVSRRSDDDDLSHSQNDVSETIFKMDSLDEPLSKVENEKAQTEQLTVDKTPSKTPDDPLSESKSSKKKRKKMRKKNATRKSSTNSYVASSTSDAVDNRTNGSTTDRSSLDSNSSEPELKETPVKADKVDMDSSQNDSTNLKRLDADFHFFSDTELTSGNVESKSNSPMNIESVQSDSEIEMKPRMKDDPKQPAKSWEWGGFPNVTPTASPINEEPAKDAHKSMLSNMLSFMKSKHNSRFDEGGVYLSDITSGDINQEVADIYFSKIKKKTSEDIDMDCESGNGPSLTQSPNSAEGCKSIDSDFDEQTKLVQTYPQEILLSLCGWDPNLTQERFDEYRVSFSDFCNNPVILENPKMVAKIHDKFYTWKVASPMLISAICFGRPLIQSCVDDLSNTFMAVQGSKDKPPEAKSQTNKSSWWSWRSKSSREATPAKEEPKIKPAPAEVAEEVQEIKVEIPVTEVAEVKEEQKVTEKQEIVEEETSPKISPDKCRKTLRLSSKQISSLNLRDGMNEVQFSVTTAYQGTTRCHCHLYKWKWDDKIVISDIDGTITKSDVLGHLLPIVGKDWAQSGVAQLFNKIRDNGYKLLYLSARAIGQARTTREYLKSIKQEDMNMPDGPMLLNPTSLITAFHSEVIERKPEAFKISCLSDIKALFPADSEPFYAGYGNKINDAWAYVAVGIPKHRIFTINPKGELKHELTQTFQSSYTGQSLQVNTVFPPILNEIVSSDSSGDEEDDSSASDS